LANILPPDLWGQRVDAMGIRLSDSPVWNLVQRLHGELAAAGIDFRPAYYVSNEWGCPDGQPLIGIPFYLVDPRFHKFEEEHADDLEDDERILAGLRHEVGHAINYAYRLHEDAEWTRHFGDFGRRYDDDYRAVPFSRRFVRHLPGWYAQKHPDEDFAETFAVWLTPGMEWRQRYAGWDALAKLEFVDRVIPRVGKLTPVVDPAATVPDPDELAFTVAEFYQLRAHTDSPPLDEIGTRLDDDLRELFPPCGVGTDAASLLRERRKSMMRSVSACTGSRMYVVKAILDHLAGRLRTLGLRAAPARELDAIAGLTAMATTLTTQFITTGHFVAPDELPTAA
jgi:hypothetical protein